MSNVFENLAAGSYDIQVKDANDCISIVVSVAVSEPSALSAEASGTDLSCNGAADGTVSVVESGGTPGYSYDWENNADQGNSIGTTASLSGLAAGTYNVTVTDANGCTATSSVTISEPTAVTASATATDASCNGFGDGSVTVVAGGGTPGYSYNWENDANQGTSVGVTATVTGLAAGTYNVTVTDDNGCTATANATINEPVAVAASIGSVNNVSCNGGSDGSATASGTGGTIASDYSYAWSNGETTATASNLGAGPHTVTITDDNGCTATASVTITEPAAVTFTSAVTAVDCNGASTGSITVTAAGGTPAYTYSRDGGANFQVSNVFENLAAGSYDIQVKDANDCISIVVSVAVSEPSALSAEASGTDLSCNGAADGTVSVVESGGTPGYSYDWENNADQGNSIGTTASLSGLAAGTYNVTVTDNNGCTATSSVTISEPTAVTASATATDASCNGFGDGSVTVVAGGGTPGYSYNWENNANQGTSVGVTATVTGLAAGTYNVTVTDDNGCTATANATINEPVAVAASIGSVNNVSCNGGSDGSATASGTGGTIASDYSYAWSNGETTATASNLGAGPHTVTITDDNGCTATASVTITEPAAVTFTSAVTAVDCNGASTGSITVTAAGGTPAYTYSRDGGANFQVSNVFENLAAGSYDIQVKDANDCISIVVSVAVSEPSALSAEASGTDLSCNGAADGTVSVVESGGTPGYSYDWENNADQGNSIGTTASLSGLAAGTYNVTVTDNNGCTATSSVTISEPTAVTASATATDASCNGFGDGSVTVVAGGGTPGYSYNWENDANQGTSVGVTATVTGLAAGTYNVTVTDDNGCTATANATINEPVAVAASIGSVNNVSCNGGSDGSATASGTGGTIASDYSYAWSNGETTATASNLGAGPHTVTITDDNGCTATASVTITEPAAVTFTSAVTAVDCNGASTGSITVTAAGGTPAYMYSGDGGANFQVSNVFENLAAGSYDIQVKDANDCISIVVSVAVSEPSALSAEASGTDLSCNGAADGTVSVVESGGTPGYSYDWENNADQGNSIGTTASLSGLAAGTYNVTVTDNNGCTATSSVTISEPTAVTASATATDASCNGFGDGSVTVVAGGGTPGYSYNWENDANQGTSVGVTATVTGLAAGTYNVTVTDDNGCTATANATINEPVAVAASIGSVNNVSCNGGSDGSATASGTGGTIASDYSYAWSNGETTATASNLGAGPHTVTITDDNGCTATASVTITEPAAVTFTSAVTAVDCNGASTGSITVTAAGGTPAYMYSRRWRSQLPGEQCI